MNEEDKSKNLHAWIDPEMEARIVALILGEASDFEREELERIIADNPEMLAFRRRVEEIHSALSELSESVENTTDDWKLPVANREMLEAVFSGEAVSGDEEPADDSEGEALVIRQPWYWGKSVKIAAIVVVLLGVGAIVMTTFHNIKAPMVLADNATASPADYRDFGAPMRESGGSDYALSPAEPTAPTMHRWAESDIDSDGFSDEFARSPHFSTPASSREDRRLESGVSAPQPESKSTFGWKTKEGSSLLWDHEAGASGLAREREEDSERAIEVMDLAEVTATTGGRQIVPRPKIQSVNGGTTWAAQPGVIQDASESIRASRDSSGLGYAGGGAELKPDDALVNITTEDGPAVKRPAKPVMERVDRLEQKEEMLQQLQPVVEESLERVEELKQLELPEMEKEQELAEEIVIAGKSMTQDKVVRRETALFEDGLTQPAAQVDPMSAEVDSGIVIDSKRERRDSERKEQVEGKVKADGDRAFTRQFLGGANNLKGFDFREVEGNNENDEAVSGGNQSGSVVMESGVRVPSPAGQPAQPVVSSSAFSGIAMPDVTGYPGSDAPSDLSNTFPALKHGEGKETAKLSKDEFSDSSGKFNFSIGAQFDGVDDSVKTEEESLSKAKELDESGGEVFKRASREAELRFASRDNFFLSRGEEKAARSQSSEQLSNFDDDRKKIKKKKAADTYANGVATYFDSLSSEIVDDSEVVDEDDKRRSLLNERNLLTRVGEKTSGSVNFGAGFSSVDDLGEVEKSKQGAFTFPDTPATPTQFETRFWGGALRADTQAATATSDFSAYRRKSGDEVNAGGFLDMDSDEELGRVRSRADDENRRIDLGVEPDVVDFEGFVSYESEQREAGGKDRIPQLGDLPLLGRLFRRDSAESKQKVEHLYNYQEGRESNGKLGLLASENGRGNEWFSSRGEDAAVDITREFIYPTEYDPPEIPNTVAPASNPVPVRPLLFASAPPAGLDEKSAKAEPFSTFSLNVSDVSFKLAKAALENNQWPEADKIRIEEFVNAFDYGDPLPASNDKVACRVEQAIHPFLQQRNLVRVAMRTGAAGRAAETPLKLTFLLDNSGSMERADRQETVRRAFAELAKQLKPNDQVTLISFARQPRLLADKVGGEQANDLVTAVKNMPSEGGTNLEAALNLAFEKAQEQQADDAQNRIVLLTDGAANLGDADPASLSKKIEQFREAGIAFDAAGIVAEGLNDEILEALTRKGDGRYYLLDSPADAGDGFAEKVAGALRPSAKNVKVQVEFNPERVGNYKLLGFEKHRLKKEDFRNDAVDAAEMAAEETGVAVYQIETLPGGSGDIGSVSVRFRDLSSDQMIENRWPISYFASAPRPDQSAASMRVATAASMFAAKLKGGPLGEAVDLEVVAKLITGLPERFSDSERIAELQSMVAKARELEGSGQ